MFHTKQIRYWSLIGIEYCPTRVADKLLQPVSWRDAKVVDVVRRVQLTQLFLRSTLYLSTEARSLFTIPDPLRRIVGKGLNAFPMLPLHDSNVKR